MPKPEASVEPSPARRRRRSAQEILDRILSAATSEFEEHGYSGATTAAIARRADVTEAQIFRLFESKGELYREAVFQPLNRHFAEFQARNLVDAESQEPERVLARRYINELQDFMSEHSGMLMSLIVAQAYSQTSAESLTDIEGLKAYFEQGRATMEGRATGSRKVRPELMVRVSFAAVLASVMFKDWLFPPGMATDEEIREAIVDFTIDGISGNDQSVL